MPKNATKAAMPPPTTVAAPSFETSKVVVGLAGPDPVPERVGMAIVLPLDGVVPLTALGRGVGDAGVYVVLSPISPCRMIQLLISSGRLENHPGVAVENCAARSDESLPVSVASARSEEGSAVTSTP